LEVNGVVIDEEPYELRVEQVTWEAEGIVSLRLVQPDGRELPRWEAGSHVDLILPSGLIRQYSLSGSMNDHFSYRVSVLNELQSRGGSREIHESSLVGKLLTVRGPRNHFHLIDVDRFVFIAGGIGITPILPMIHEVQSRGRPWRLIYGGRSRQTMAFLSDLGEMTSGQIDLVPEDEIGYPDLDAILQTVGEDTAVFACGPPGMLAAIEERCTKYLPSGALHLERFTAPEGTTAPALTADENTCEIKLARQGVTITVPSDQTLLRAIRDVIPSILYSCEEGYCGTCETRVLEGTPDHRDTILTDEERESNTTIMICVSRSKSPGLVLDL
jgi:ferredoxin-NADP reductase